MPKDACVYCLGDGTNEHGNECEFCDGHGEIEADRAVPDEDEDETRRGGERGR